MNNLGYVNEKDVCVNFEFGSYKEYIDKNNMKNIFVVFFWIICAILIIVRLSSVFFNRRNKINGTTFFSNETIKNCIVIVISFISVFNSFVRCYSYTKVHNWPIFEIFCFFNCSFSFFIIFIYMLCKYKITGKMRLSFMISNAISLIFQLTLFNYFKFYLIFDDVLSQHYLELIIISLFQIFFIFIVK